MDDGQPMAAEYARELTHKPFINCAGVLQDEPDWQAMTHFHAHITELQYVVEGHGIMTVDGTSYAISPGDVVVIHSGEVHKDDFHRSEVPTFTYFLRFTEYQVQGLEPNRLLKKGASPIVHAQAISGHMQFYFESIFSECNEQASGFESIVDNYLAALVRLILRITAGSEVESRKKQGSLARDIKEYIDHNLLSPLTVSMIAQSLNVSVYHLMHVFRNEIGIAPIQYLTNRRIAEAKKMLSNSIMAINEIAHSLGYESPSHFNTQFKRIVGITPGQYRKQNRGLDDYHSEVM